MVTVRFPNFASFPSIFQEMERMRRDMDRRLSPFMRRVPLAADSGVFPALNVIEESERFLVHAELPGVRLEDIEISMEGNTLTPGESERGSTWAMRGTTAMRELRGGCRRP